MSKSLLLELFNDRRTLNDGNLHCIGCDISAVEGRMRSKVEGHDHTKYGRKSWWHIYQWLSGEFCLVNSDLVDY